jgi:hypothetical protein
MRDKSRRNKKYFSKKDRPIGSLIDNKSSGRGDIAKVK